MNTTFVARFGKNNKTTCFAREATIFYHRHHHHRDKTDGKIYDDIVRYKILENNTFPIFKSYNVYAIKFDICTGCFEIIHALWKKTQALTEINFTHKLKKIQAIKWKKFKHKMHKKSLGKPAIMCSPASCKAFADIQ